MRNSIRDRAEKSIDSNLRVHVWTPAGFLSAGILSLQEDGDQILASFQYDEAYLRHDGAFPLDPKNLPLSARRVDTASQYERLGSIFDAAPDAWGRRVVTAQLPQESRERVFRGAFLRGADGIGALVMTPESLTSQLDMDRIVGLSLAERPGLSQLQFAASAAREFESGLELTEEMRMMLGGSWTIGGARPKAILRDDRPGALPGASVIAKFGSRNDIISRIRLEYASLQMAADMHLPVPARDLIELGNGEAALVLERFDRNIVDARVHRRHYLSAMSLASHQPQSKFLDSAKDRAMLSWSALLEMSSRFCAHPNAARVEMFGRLCLNVALQNTDDHLKNFGFLRCVDSPVQYEIAPVFDVSPQGGQRHYLHCAELGQVYSLAQVLGNGRALGIAKSACQEVEDRLVTVLSRRLDYFEAAGMSAADARKANTWIEAGMGPRYLAQPLTAQDIPSEPPPEPSPAC